MESLFTIYPDVAIAKRRRAHATITPDTKRTRWFDSLSEALMDAFDNGYRDVVIVGDPLTFTIHIERVVERSQIDQLVSLPRVDVTQQDQE